MNREQAARALEIEKTLTPIVRAAYAVRPEDLAVVLEVLEWKDAFEPFTDPTLWLRGSADVTRVALRLARAFAEFRGELERIKAEAGPRFLERWLATAMAAEAAKEGRR